MESFESKSNKRDEPCIPIGELRQWILGKNVLSVAESSTIEAAEITTARDDFRQGLDTAVQRGRIEILKELTEFIEEHAKGIE